MAPKKQAVLQALFRILYINVTAYGRADGCDIYNDAQNLSRALDN